jgi:hypothetical protein
MRCPDLFRAFAFDDCAIDALARIAPEPAQKILYHLR